MNLLNFDPKNYPYEDGQCYDCGSEREHPHAPWCCCAPYVAPPPVSRIEFTAWGSRIDTLDMPAYAMTDPDGIDGPAGRVAGAIARKNGLEVITMRGDGTALDRHGKPSENHYQVTLGHACRGGGWTPTHEIWIAVPLSAWPA